MEEFAVSENPPVFIVVDGHSLAFRAYFAFGKSRQGGLKTSRGIPTSVCFGFIKSLLEVMATQKPDYLAIAFDRREPTFRHEAYENYKADRAETPMDFVEDVNNLKELLQALNLPVITYKGFEADDILGTLANQGSAAGFRVKILSGDQDLFQLVDPEKGISVLHLSSGKGGTPAEFGPEQVFDKLNIKPEQVIDYKALCGDKSDNIPGVRGIGEKTAVQLLQKYGSLDNIYASLDDIKGATRQKLETGKEDAYHSHKMARIVQDVPLEVTLEACRLQGFDLAEVQPILQKLEFQNFINQIQQIQQQFKGIPQVEISPQEDISESVKVEELIVSDAESEDKDEDEDDDLWFFSREDTLAVETQKPQGIKPKIIQSLEELQGLVERLKTFTDGNIPVAWDTETTALDPFDAELVGIGCCWGSATNDIAYIPLGHTQGKNLDLTATLEILQPILESDRYPKVLQNAKYDRLVFRVQGIELAGVVFDPMLASYVLNPEDSHNLSSLCLKYLGSDLVAMSYDQLVQKGKTIAEISIPAVANYCGMDVYTTFLLVNQLKPKFEDKPKLYQLLNEIEFPLEPVLAEMEFQGIRIDINYLKQLSQQLEKTLAEIEKKAYQDAGEEFNLGSPKQLSKLLFETLGLNVKKTRQTKTGYSTDAAVLEKLQGDHPVIDSIIEHRTLAKLKSTYVNALPQLVRPETQRVHTDFNQAVTATGRLSSSNPNLQNIPIRTEFSRQIRKAFIPEPGWLLVSADYSQIELRILAHLSQEPVLVEAYNTNQDVHTVTAKLLFEKETVTSDERRLGKTINFGVIYGMGSLRFARSVGMTTAQGKQFIERFNARYPRVFEYLETVKKQAISQTYVKTLFGRRRYFDFQGKSLQNLKGTPPDQIDLSQLKNIGQYDAQFLRAAANAPIQGSSADIIKIAMVKLGELLKPYQARLLLQVHDELVFEVPQNEWAQLQPLIKETMENAVSLRVPLIVDIHAGENWMEAK